jgi:hypothetical protein
MTRIACPGDAYFSKHALDRAYNQAKGSRETVVHMPPETFLKMAKTLNEPSSDKLGGAKHLVADGVKFESLPYLTIDTREDGDVYVSGHEGRHRSITLIGMGVKLIPVILVSQADEGPAYRWGQTSKRPKRIYGQSSGSFKMPKTETY